jgi:hypothetical protein
VLLGPIRALTGRNMSGFAQVPTCVGVDLHHAEGNLYKTLETTEEKYSFSCLKVL